MMRPARPLVLVLVLALATACAPPPRSTPAPAAPPSGAPIISAPPVVNVGAVTDDMIARTNGARRAAGVPALARSAALMAAAQLQADQMVRVGRMEHELPGQAYGTLRSRLAAVRYEVRAAAENIAEGQRSAAEVVVTWLDSPDHRVNMLSREYTEMGSGVAAARNGRLYFAQVFGRPAPPPLVRASPPK